MNIVTTIESILFVASKPLTLATLAKTLGKNEADIADAIETLKMKYNREDSGIHILTIEDGVQMGTNPAHAETVEKFVQHELSGELTKAQLETLTVIAYRGPITRPELEQIRGVNCALIIRNLLIRGLIEEQDSAEKLSAVYTMSFSALQHLGISSPSELPEYAELHAHAHVEQVLQIAEEEIA